MVKSVTATIRNSIFAKTKNVNASGILLSNYTSVNNHQSNDYVVAREGVKSVTTYAKPSADLFVNPESADFTIKDASFAGKSTAGDPRWRIQ